MFSVQNRYSQAFFDLCKQHEWLDVVYEDFQSISHLIDINQDLDNFFESALFDHSKRVETINKIFENKVDQVTLRLMLFLEEKKHLYLFKSIVEDYLNYYRKENNIQKIKIVSSIYLDQKELDYISENFKNSLKKKIEYELVIDSNLLGGIKVYVGDLVYDFSLKNQLHRFREKILTAI